MRESICYYPQISGRNSLDKWLKKARTVQCGGFN